MAQSSRRTRTTEVILAAVAGLASMGLLPWLDKPLGSDEGASLYSAHLDWAALLQQSHVVDLVLLPYYSFLHLWIAYSDNIEWVRFPSLLAFGVTVFLVGRLGIRLGGNTCGVLAATLVATNPIMVSSALDARPYALSVLVCTGAGIALIRWLDGGGVRWVWWFCLACVAAVLLQMFSVLAPLSVLGVAVALRPQMFRAQRRELIAPIGILLAAPASFAVLTAHQAKQISWIRFGHGLRSVAGSLLGPAYDGQKAYTAAVLAVVLAGIGLRLLAWRRSRFRPTRRELDFFTIALGWAFLPTLALVAMSFVKPVYLTRYVSASAPGLAIAVGLLTASAFDLIAVRWADGSRLSVGGTALAIFALVVVSTCSVPAAQRVAQNLNLPVAAQYLVGHVGHEGEAALPDHSLTTGIDYYLRINHEKLRIWPQLAEQPHIDGLDLRQDRQATASAPDDVWLLEDGSFPRTSGFIATLKQNGYSWVGTTQLPGVRILHFRRSDGLASTSESPG
jgi:hypothetical protein